LIAERDWEGAAHVIERYANKPPTAATDIAETVDARVRVAFAEACAAVDAVSVPTSVHADLLKVLRVLKIKHSLNEQNSQMSDRTFLVKASKVLKVGLEH
jgi:hypothetical protein